MSEKANNIKINKKTTENENGNSNKLKMKITWAAVSFLLTACFVRLYNFLLCHTK